MGIYQLSNVPTAASELEIHGRIEGENVKIVATQRNAAPHDYLIMTTSYYGDHMLAKPEVLRRMIAEDIATAIRLGRDAGYAQAKAEIRKVLGI